ncbi:MAG: nicotinamide mononucleotide transporter, partial [Mycoplasmataceae bacterium]|nr:nicotinamide mononucleotide transporter [Mycoplasmataceae bacterium]
METFFKKFKNSFTNQKDNLDFFSKVFFSIFLLAILLSSILGFALSTEDNLAWVVTISTLSSLFGSVTVFLLATKNYNGYIYGVIQVIFYGIVSIYWSLWGQVFLSFAIYLPANISGYFLWKTHIERKYRTKSRDISNEKFLVIIIIALLAAVGISYIFKSFTNN